METREKDNFQGQTQCERCDGRRVCVCTCVSKSFLVTESAHRLYDPAQWAGLLHHHPPPQHTLIHTPSCTHTYVPHISCLHAVCLSLSTSNKFTQTHTHLLLLVFVFYCFLPPLLLLLACFISAPSLELKYTKRLQEIPYDAKVLTLKCALQG